MLTRHFFISILFLGNFFAISQETTTKLETVLQNGHARQMTAYAFSHDGNFIATGSEDHKIILWHLASGKIVRVFSMHTGSIRNIEFSKNDEWILSGAADNMAYVHEVKTGKIIQSFAMDSDRLWETHFFGNDEKVALSDNRDLVKLFNLKSAELEITLKKEYSAPFSALSFSPLKSSVLSLVNYNGFVEIDYSTGDTLASFESDKPRMLSYSPNGKFIAASSRMLLTDVFDANTGKLLYQLINDEEKCDGCNNLHAFTNDNSSVLTVSNKTDAVLWDLSTGKRLKTFKTIKERPSCLFFSPDDSKLFISYSDFVVIYDVKSGNEKVKIESEKIDYYHFSISPNNEFFAFPGENNEIELRDVNSGRPKEKFSGYLNVARGDGTRFSYENWGDSGILKYINRKREVLFSPDDQFIAISQIDSVAILLNANTGRVVHTLKGHSQVVIGMDFSNSGEFLLTCSADRTIKIWEVKSGKLIKTLVGHSEVVFDATFSSDDNYILSSSWDGSLALWEWRSNSRRFIDFGGDSPYAVALSKNDLYMAVGNLGHKLSLYEFDSGERAKDLIGHTSITSNIVLNPTTNDLISSSWDGSVKVWDFNSATLIGKLTSFQGGVFAVDIHPLSNVVAAAGADRDIRIWDYKTNKIIKRLIGHNSPVTGLNFNSNGTKLVSQSEDGVLKIWDMITGEEIYTRLQISRNEWLATQKNGFFDGSSEAIKNVNYVSGNEVLPINSFFKKYYSPGLIERLNNGEAFNDQGSHFQESMKDAPDLQLLIAGKRDLSLFSQDTLKNWTDESIQLELKINTNGISLNDIRIYNNGKLVFNEAMEKDIVFRGLPSENKKIEIDLNQGINTIRAVVINKEGVESVPVELVIDKSGTATKPKLFIVAVGINEYKNPNYHLNYAVNDAIAFSLAISEQATGLFEEIIVKNIVNEAATKEGIKKELELLKPSITANDVFVFFYAGHGVLGEIEETGKEEFYMVMQDLTNLYGGEEVMRSQGFSASELFQYSLEIEAQKQLFVIDACHSGGALNTIAQRGAEREKIIAQLARSSGSYFLTASQSAEYANEAGDLNHGLFTYAILEILGGEVKDSDNKITVGEIKSYVEQRVPVLSEEQQGTPQYPTGYAFGQDFPLVLSK